MARGRAATKTDRCRWQPSRRDGSQPPETFEVISRATATFGKLLQSDTSSAGETAVIANALSSGMARGPIAATGRGVTGRAVGTTLAAQSRGRCAQSLSCQFGPPLMQGCHVRPARRKDVGASRWNVTPAPHPSLSRSTAKGRCAASARGTRKCSVDFDIGRQPKADGSQLRIVVRAMRAPE